MNARDIWFKILDSQIETGTPYMLYKDACNIKSNQKNLGTIKSSNLCCEIVEYSDDKETAVCNLASIALSKFVNETKSPFTNKVRLYSKNDCKWCDLLKALLKRKNVEYEEIKVSVDGFDNFKKEHGIETLPQLYHGDELVGGYTDSLNVLKNKFDYDKLLEITKVVTENLNNVIDINFYPTEKTKASNLRHRPIGIGVQGLADAFAMMDVPYHSEEAKQINKNIFETIYYGALKASNELAQGHGCYESFTKNGGCPASKGILQFDLWGVTPSDRYEWDVLKLDIKKHGLRNSLLVAPMPTASTSQILGNNECFEPFTSNIYLRRTLAGEFTMINKFLIKELIELGLWNEDLKNRIIQDSGSVQKIKEIPKQLKLKYKTVWEIPMKHVLEMCADRGAYICQSQSTNLWMKNPSYDKLTAMHFFAWSRGLKTGIYYLRTKAKAAPQQFTIEPDKKNVVQEEEEDCLMCGS
jgi:ribonucleoside-diphosphate reductase subunit M1